MADITAYTKQQADQLLGGKYTKPSDGVPKSDLASAVQTSLEKADAALTQPVADGRYAPVGAGVNPNDVGYDVVLVVGQSNAVGYGNGLDTAYLDTADARIVQWPASGAYVGQAVTAVDPLFHREQFAGGVGHAVAFGKRLIASSPPNRRVMIVPAAMGSTGFSTSSLASPPTGYYTVTGGSWDTTGAAGGINLYQSAIDQANAAISSGANNRLVAILWLGGEADSKSATAMTDSQYQVALLALIDGLRANVVGASQVPFLVGQMLDAAIAAIGAKRQAVDKVHPVSYTHLTLPTKRIV